MNPNGPQPITFQPDIYDAVLKLLPETRPLRMLDVGAGEGYFCRQLKDRGVDVEACDFLEGNFKCPDVPFIKADLNGTWPAETDRYDCAVSIEVMEHIENHFQFMREMIRVTKPGGRIIITTPNVLSMTSRRHFFLYGYTDCAPRPLDPNREDYFMQHINPVSLAELLFLFERFGADLETLTTNRIRRGSVLAMILWYPVLWTAMRLKWLRPKYREQQTLYRRHMRWLLKPANLLGRITIAAARKR